MPVPYGMAGSLDRRRNGLPAMMPLREEELLQEVQRHLGNEHRWEKRGTLRSGRNDFGAARTEHRFQQDIAAAERISALAARTAVDVFGGQEYDDDDDDNEIGGFFFNENFDEDDAGAAATPAHSPLPADREPFVRIVAPHSPVQPPPSPLPLPQNHEDVEDDPSPPSTTTTPLKRKAGRPAGSRFAFQRPQQQDKWWSVSQATWDEGAMKNKWDNGYRWSRVARAQEEGQLRESKGAVLACALCKN